ncbi:MAG TPA: hypothetical protein PKX44_00885 [Methanomassiliicoccaceae archaeon]|nr:hypothetical protein [Methanomassiliicoccaceae archaeon]
MEVVGGMSRPLGGWAGGHADGDVRDLAGHGDAETMIPYLDRLG